MIFGTVINMDTVIASICLLFVTSIASYIYYQKILDAKLEYEKSKNLVENIIFGFTRQLNRVINKISTLEENVLEVHTLTSETVKPNNNFQQISEVPDSYFKGLENKINEHENTIKELKNKLTTLANRPTARVTSREVDAPIPVEESDVLNQLTDTELEVLTIIQDIGESSVPQIREKIMKTREHTARLLKKLFEKGFIDRNTSSMPYRYHIRKEIEELIETQKKQLNISN